MSIAELDEPTEATPTRRSALLGGLAAGAAALASACAPGAPAESAAAGGLDQLLSKNVYNVLR